MVKAKGGKNVYGTAVGILMLESQFPRIPGDDFYSFVTWFRAELRPRRFS